MPSIALSTYSLFVTKNHLQAMEFAIENEFQRIEIWSNVFDFSPKRGSAREIDTIKALARGNHISLAMHFCGGNNSVDINEGHLAYS
jgi:hypothetical protein